MLIAKDVSYIHNRIYRYGYFCMNKINVEIPRGQIVGLFGDNGSGKTTLLRCLADIYQSIRVKLN